MSHLDSAPEKGHLVRVPLLPLGILLLVVFAIEAIMLKTISQNGDYVFHIHAADALSRGGSVNFPHRLYQWLTIGLHSLIPGIKFSEAGIGAALVAHLLLASTVVLSLYRQLRGQRPWLAAALTLGLILTGPILLLNLEGTGLYFGYQHIFTYHNPTSTLMRPLALIVFLYAASAFVPPVATWGQVAIAAFVSLLLSNAKPNYSLALLPMAGLMAVYRLVRRRFVDLKMLTAILGVMVLFLALQYVTTYDGDGARMGLALQPFALLQERGLSVSMIVIKQVLSFIFPAAILFLYWSSARRDTLLMLAWACFGVGAFYTLALVELGARREHYNFYWSGEITLFLLFFASIHFWLRQMGGRFDLSTRRAQIALILWILHILSGVYWYVMQSGAMPVYQVW